MSERLDRVVRLARRICDVPVATVEIVAAPGQRLAPVDKAKRSRQLEFHKEVELQLGGRPVGVLHLGDFVPRTLDAFQEDMLQELASLAAEQIGEGAVQRHLADENQALKTRAFVDSLTSLWNRQTIVEIALSEVEDARHHEQPVGLAFIDLDFFKQVNDRHGHAAGDAVLREVGARLRAAIRATDAAGRHGGEEFLVVMPACSLAECLAAAERIRLAIAEPIAVDGLQLKVTASIGVAVHEPGSRTLDETIRAADLAVYSAKARGRNRVEAAPAEGTRSMS